MEFPRECNTKTLEQDIKNVQSAIFDYKRPSDKPNTYLQPLHTPAVETFLESSANLARFAMSQLEQQDTQ